MDLCKLLCEYRSESVGGKSTAGFPAARQHRGLTLHYFAHIAIKKNHAIRAIVGELGEEHVNHLDNFAARIVEPRLVGSKRLYALKLEVAARVVLVGCAEGIGDRRNATRNDHLHRHARARAR